MRHSTLTKSIFLTIGAVLLVLHPIIAQDPLSIDEHDQFPDKETVITKADEEISLLSFIYSASSRSYEATCNNTEFDEEAIGFMSVFLSFEPDGKFFYLPHAEEDARTFKRGDLYFSYVVDLGGMIQVNIHNPKGGSPWSTLDSDRLTVRLYHTTMDISPYQAQGLDLENEHVFSILTEGYMNNQLTVW